MPTNDEIRQALRNLRPPPTGHMQIENIPRLYRKEMPGREEFEKFYEHFSTCPVCKIRNHESYLEDFYFSDVIEKVKIKQQLLNLLSQLENYLDNISVGIPCCSCYELMFQTKNEGMVIGYPTSLRSQLMAELREIFYGRRID